MENTYDKLEQLRKTMVDDQQLLDLQEHSTVDNTKMKQRADVSGPLDSGRTIR